MTKFEKMLAEQWADIAHCAALIERMLPNYELFQQLTGQGDILVLKNCLDVIWGAVAGHEQSVDFNKQIEKMELITPDSQEDDSFGARLAQDSCASLIQLLSVCALNEPLNITDFMTMNHSTIEAYLEVIAYDDSFVGHPLMSDANAYNKELIYKLENKSLSRMALANELKHFSRSFAISNIGIESEP